MAYFSTNTRRVRAPAKLGPRSGVDISLLTARLPLRVFDLLFGISRLIYRLGYLIQGGSTSSCCNPPPPQAVAPTKSTKITTIRMAVSVERVVIFVLQRSLLAIYPLIIAAWLATRLLWPGASDWSQGYSDSKEAPSTVT